jgi:hypothetical protein
MHAVPEYFNVSCSKSGKAIVYDFAITVAISGKFYARSPRRASPNEQPGLGQ